MGKVKKEASGDSKIKKRHSIATITENKKTFKNKRKTLDGVSSASLKPLKNLGGSNGNLLKLSNKGNLTITKKEKSPKINKNTPKINKKSPKVKERKSIVNGKHNIKVLASTNSSNNQKIGSEAFEDNTSPKRKVKKSKNSKPIEEKFTPKIKTNNFKAKSHTFKVKTELILHQKPKQEDTNIDFTINLEENTVKSGIKALFKLIEEKKSDTTLFEDESPIFLQFSSIKIGNTPSRTLRIPLKHSLFKDSSEVCLIISDMRGRHTKEFEKAIEQCDGLLKEKGVTNIKTILTYYQLRTDYSELELKRKLVELYDVFLADAKISGYVVRKLGKIFRNKRKLPIPIRLDANNLKDHIKFALSKTSTNLHPNGDNFVIQVAHSDMKEEEVYENIVEACTNLSKQFPGGWANIRGLNIKTAKSMAIPIYYTLKNAAEISVPAVKAKRPKAYKPVSGELSTAYDKMVTVLPTGEVKLDIKKKKNKKRTAEESEKSQEKNNGIPQKKNGKLSKKLEEKKQKKRSIKKKEKKMKKLGLKKERTVE